MSETATLKTIAKGGLIFTAGKFGATFLQFFSGLIIIHAIDKAEYGLFSLGQVWVSIAITFSSLGLGSGLPRIIAKYAAKKQMEDVDGVIASSLFLVTGITLLIWIGFLGYAIIILNTADSQKYQIVWIFLSFTIIPTALINTLCAIFRGFEKIEPEVIYNTILPNIIKIVLLGMFISMGMALQGVLATQVLTIWITLFMLTLYTSKRLIKNLPVRNLLPFSKEVFLFSLPLIGIQLMGQLMNWIPLLALGQFHLAEEVGLFNAPTRLTGLFPIPLMAVMTLYLPIATRHYEEHQIEKIQPIYQTSTKWSFLLTLPICLFAIFDSSFITITLFGNAYKEAAPVLMVLSMGNCIHSFFGPNGITLISCGNRKIVFWSTVFSTLVMIGTAVILIPPYGALGASIAFTVAMVVSNIFISFLLNFHYHIHPFTLHYLKPVLLTVGVAFASHFLIRLKNLDGWYIHILFLLILVLCAFFSPRITGSLSQDDLDMLNLVKKRFKRQTET